MEPSGEHTIYSVGHSTHTLEEFIRMLKSFDIVDLVDVRRFPGSRKYPHFNKENLAAALREVGINYTHLEDLGGRRKVQKDSKNSRWRNDSFRGYADYMETKDFEKAVTKLEAIAVGQATVYMCSEAVWWRCHRSMISDYLKAKGWKVFHIMSVGKAGEHPYTSAAEVVRDRVCYRSETIFNQ